MSLNVEIGEALSRLYPVVERLSQSVTDQLLYLSEIGVPEGTDELALEFDDLYKPLRWRLAEAGSFQDLIRRLDAIDSIFVRMGEGGAEVWTASALLAADDWEELRLAASGAITNWPSD